MTRNQIEYQRNLETERNNRVVAAETERSNRAREAETERANRERERQGVISLDETGRHNVVTENYNWGSLQESGRHNRRTESLTGFNYSEFARHNQALEAIQQSLNERQVAETERHNRATEQISYSDQANRKDIAQMQVDSAMAVQQLRSLTDAQLGVLSASSQYFIQKLRNSSARELKEIEKSIADRQFYYDAAMDVFRELKSIVPGIAKSGMEVLR